jgi:formylglycine-generating enzyme required for sulfatase activity
MDSPEGSGEPNETPRHEVCLSEFHISKHEVTFDQYDAYALSEEKPLPSDFGWGRGDRPVIDVSWDDARAYAQWLSGRIEGLACGLPSEAEWEYAARAGSETPWHWGEEEAAAAKYAWFYRNSRGKTRTVGTRHPNGFGLYDMAGNVWEWVEDCWHENYANAPEDGRAWLDEDGGDCTRRVLRGGSWNGGPVLLRSAYRLRLHPDGRNYSFSFRLVCRPQLPPNH